MREIVFDTETTGFEPSDGHRIVEIGCVELVDHFPTGNTFQAYLNPEREVPMDSQRVHGLSNDFLADKPFFAAVAEEFLAFIGDAPLVIHNASFDIKFINAELARTGHPAIPLSRAIDTIEIAKRKIPGARYSLDEPESPRAHQRPQPLAPRISVEELALHLAFVEKELGADAIWNQV